MCNRHGCPAYAQGALRLNIPYVGANDLAANPLQFFTPLELCDAHQAEADPAGFMPTEWRLQVRLILKERKAVAEPDFDRAFFDAVPLDYPAYVQWRIEHQETQQ